MLKPDAPIKFRLAAAKAVLEVCGHPEPESYGPTTPEGVRRAWKQAERSRVEAMHSRAEAIVDGRQMAALTRFGDLTDSAREAEIAKVLDELREAGADQDQDA